MSTASAAPEVAIVIPCYRYAHMLADAVRSACAQTWPNLHIVIVDDGSPDATPATAAALIAEFPERRIDYVHQHNQGLAAARNTGVRATSSPFVLPLDADDRLEPQAVERLVAALEAGADVATPLGRTFGDEDRRLVTLAVTPRRLRAGNCLVYASMFRRELFDRTGGYALNLRAGYEDWDFWLSALEAGGRFTHVAEELFCYRRHGATMLTGADRQALQLRATIVMNHPALFPRWRVRLAEKLLRAGGRAGFWLRLAMASTLLLDRRVRQFCRQLGALRATNMLST